MLSVFRLISLLFKLFERGRAEKDIDSRKIFLLKLHGPLGIDHQKDVIAHFLLFMDKSSRSAVMIPENLGIFKEIPFANLFFKFLLGKEMVILPFHLS